MYSQDYDETLPLVQEHYRVKYINVSTPGDSWYGLINVYVTSEKSFECPADLFKVNATELMGASDRFLLSYGFNAVCDADSEADYGRWSRVAPNMTVENPSATLMLADTGKVHGALYPFVGSIMEDGGYLAYRHGDTFNVAFMDGHAAAFNNKLNRRIPDKIKLGLTNTAY
jgi:prepilin-type processing-associated H-X9-DG protein